MFKIGCHVSAAGGVWNAPKNAADLECEIFQIFTRPPMGGPAPKILEADIERFKSEMEKYKFSEFVVHAPYIVNFGSAKKTTFHGSISVVSEELVRANSLGASLLMIHMGSFKDLGQEKGMEQAKKGFIAVLNKYEASAKIIKTKFLLEIAAGAGEVIGDTFEELAELMEPLLKYKSFGGICFDTQHAFSGGYDFRTPKTAAETFKKFDKAIGLKWLKMSHVNDSKVPLGGRKDRHEHIGEGEIGEKGFSAFMKFLISNYKFQNKSSFPLILETEHDKVKEDIKILKKLREKI
ncbi:MAG: deoxyribonuclease IV [Candidatus Doudnabacteria bacterium]|nr:deoxyribonuclease IV [Candidatus Doudnabacteria bacterium]